MAVIDLGDLSEPDRPGPPVHQRRGFAVAVAAAACLGTLHSVPTGEPAVRTLWTAPVTRTLFAQADRDTVWTLRAVDGGGELTAYDLATGSVRWTRPTEPAAVAAESFSVLPAAGLLLVHDTVLDAATGARLWQPAGSVEAHTAGTVLLRERRPNGLRLVNARDGTTIWQRRMDRAGAVGVRSGIIAVDTGELTLLRYDDGTPLLSRSLLRQGEEEPYFSFAGDNVLVEARSGNTFTVTAYRLDTLAESWRAEMDGGGLVQDCGPVVCLSGRRGISGIDPGTGVRRWALPAGHGIWSALGNRIVTSRDPRTSDEGRQPLVSVIDARTGQRLGDEVPGQPATSTAGAGRLLVLRPRPDDPLGQISVHHLDLDTGRRVLIGEVDYQLLNSSYELVGRHLLRLLDGRLHIMTAG
ncbi:outer membrane protein assembly factor BamB family protein [Actinoplanes derwentensis]|uniref:PQQ-like domain-containing protein n=1 Tax=Actinoplanes derwentensis TaxID=113562 RepID=A0A1H1X8M4_9ACTN|nr:PQQ-binding-like beta-propeller repeat protein [Actinoplanes derwentensis]GID89604.1 hypothetical protein Ade03nite_85280 [Actinoplanes derwentensis]SDT05644.1 PQQ-like domain-containing protein [Actinoplanes derwentensis]